MSRRISKLDEPYNGITPDMMEDPGMSPDFPAADMPPEMMGDVGDEPIHLPLQDQTLIQPPLPDKKIRDEIEKYVKEFCRTSRDYVKQKESDWKLIEALYKAEITLRQWADWRSGQTDTTDVDTRTSPPADEWRTDYVHSIAELIDKYVAYAYQIIFAGPEYLVVEPDETDEIPETDESYPLAFKLQQLLQRRLCAGRFHTRIADALKHSAAYGSVYGKVFWYERAIPRARVVRNELTGEESIEEYSEVVAEYPIVQLIPLDKVLPDKAARHNDLQRWRGIGHRRDATYEQLLAEYDRGEHNLNRDEFEKRWRSGMGSVDLPAAELGEDPDAYASLKESVTWLTCWEWHGTAETTIGPIECVVNIITERGLDDPTTGLMSRLTMGPILSESGRRPFACCHFTPEPGPFGLGQVSRDSDLLYQLSQFICQLQDHVRLAANAPYLAEKGSGIEVSLEAAGNTLYPGAILFHEAGFKDPIRPWPRPDFPAQDVFNTIQLLTRQLEERTATPDIFQGLARVEKSATEANILEQTSQAPTVFRTDIFARDFIGPVAEMALELLRLMSDKPQVLMVRDAHGNMQPITITEAEMKMGRFRVMATLTNQDHTRIAKAQSIERALPTLMQFGPVLAQEGLQLSFAELLKRYLDLIGVDGADRIFVPLPPQPPEMTAMMNQPPVGQPPQAKEGKNGKPPTPLLDKGGPMGQAPTDPNAVAQMLQLMATEQQGGGMG